MTRRRYLAIIHDYCNKHSDKERTMDALLAMVREYRDIVCPAICGYVFKIPRNQRWRLCEDFGKGGWYLDDSDCPGKENPLEAEIVANAFLSELRTWAEEMTWSKLLFINWRYQYLRTIIREMIADED